MLSVDNYIDTFIIISYKIFKTPVCRLKLHKLIKISNLTIDNLVISLYLLYKFDENSVVRITDRKLAGNLIVMSLVLSNKIYNDQNYTFKTWINLIATCKINLNLKMLKQLEIFFLNVLDYKLDYKFLYKDTDFWNAISQYNQDWVIFKQFMDYDDETPTTSPIMTPLMTPRDLSSSCSPNLVANMSLPLSSALNLQTVNSQMQNPFLQPTICGPNFQFYFEPEDIPKFQMPSNFALHKKPRLHNIPLMEY